MSLRFVAKGSFDNDNESAWVQKMAWHRTGDKPLSEPIVVWFSDIYLCCLAYVSQPKMYLLLREYLDCWQRQSTALTHLHLRREAHPAWYMDTDPCIIPTDPCWMPWEVFCVAPYSGLLVFGQLWLGAIYNFLKRWTVVTDPNGTGMFLCYGFLTYMYCLYL